MWKQRLYSTKSEMTVSTWEPDLDTGSNYMEHCNERGSEIPLGRKLLWSSGSIFHDTHATHVSPWLRLQKWHWHINKQAAKKPKKSEKKLQQGQHSITSRLVYIQWDTVSTPPHTKKLSKMPIKAKNGGRSYRLHSRGWTF